MKDPNENLKALIKFRESLGVAINPNFSIENKASPMEMIKAQLEDIEGVQVKADEVEKLLDGALLAYKGVLSILYITDTQKPAEYLMDDTLRRRGGHGVKESDKAPKFHFTWCITLDQMRSKNAFDRYVMLRNKHGKFIVQAKEERFSESYKLKDPVKLYACRNCLDGALGIKQDNKIGYKGYSQKWGAGQKNTAVENFDIEAFLDENESVLNDIKYATKYDDLTAPENNYARDWPEVSARVRDQANWTCEDCHIDLSGRRNLLHAHHKNHLKTDNSPKNLIALCVLCHQKHHSHMKIPDSDSQYIKRHRP